MKQIKKIEFPLNKNIYILLLLFGLSCNIPNSNLELKEQIGSLLENHIQRDSLFNDSLSFSMNEKVTGFDWDSIYLFLDTDNQTYIREVLKNRKIENFMEPNFYVYPSSDGRSLLFFLKGSKIVDWIFFSRSDKIDFTCYNTIDTLCSVPYLVHKKNDAIFYVFEDSKRQRLDVISEECIKNRPDYWLNKHYTITDSEEGVPPQKPTD